MSDDFSLLGCRVDSLQRTGEVLFVERDLMEFIGFAYTDRGYPVGTRRCLMHLRDYVLGRRDFHQL
jgi:hypothetical protein